MAKASGVTDRLYYHGTDISGDVGSLGSISSPRALLSVTAINSTTEERVRGLGSGQIQFLAYFNDALSQPILDQLPGTDVLLLYARGATIGNPCAALTAKQINYDPTRGADGGLTFAVDAQGASGALEWGVMLTAGQVTFASAAASPPTGVVDAAQTTQGGVGYLQFASRASGTPTFLIEDSADTTNGVDGTWGTLLTFANTGGAAAFGERKTVTGAVEKGVRCGTPTGTYTNAVIAVGFRRGQAGDDEDLS